MVKYHPFLPFSGGLRRRGHKNPVALQIVSQVAQTDLGPSPDYPDSAHQQSARLLRLYPENMLDSGPGLGPRAVALLFTLGQLAVTIPLALKMLPVSLFFQLLDPILRTIGRIGPNIAAAVALIQQFLKDLTLVPHFS